MTQDTITKPHEVNQYALAAAAWEIHGETLTERGNKLGALHLIALYKMMELLAGYAAGAVNGRTAFPLPTGCGKTSGVQAFALAAQRLGYRIPMTVAASQVQALGKFKQELIELGVPESDIGLAHRDAKAEVPSTGCRPQDGRLIQLVTHARFRMQDDYLGLLGEYRGERRPLVIFDESLLRSDAFAFLAVTLESACGAFAPYAKTRTDLHAPAVYLEAAVKAIADALAAAVAGGTSGGVPLELPDLHPDVVELWKLLVASTPLARPAVAILQQLLDVSQLPLQVLPMSQGGGAVAVRQAVSHQLDRVVILDASTPIRDLVLLDPTINVYADIPQEVKTFEQVEVMQVLSPGGRESIEQTFAQAHKETSSLSREVLDIVREELRADPDRSFLVFTFKRSPRSELDITESIRRDLRAAGVREVDETLPEDDHLPQESRRHRVSFLTWGSHQGINGYEHCKTVILAGVLHRSHLDIAAQIKGQKLDLQAPTPHEEVVRVINSELGHCIYQAASRGSCRRVTLSKANPMRLWLIHKDRNMRELLAPVMPRAKWHYLEPRHMKTHRKAEKRSLMLGQILSALGGIPDGVDEVSSVRLKAAMGLSPQDGTTKRAYSRAVAALDPLRHGWRLVGKRLVRGAAAYGFTPTETSA